MASDAFSGYLAGIVSGFITTPLDVTKTYLQTQQRPTPKFVGIMPTPYYPTIWTCLVGIYARGGMRGLFTGGRIRSIWTGGQSLIMFTMYEGFLKYYRMSQ